jgi:hypothetical protein
MISLSVRMRRRGLSLRRIGVDTAVKSLSLIPGMGGRFVKTGALVPILTTF